VEVTQLTLSLLAGKTLEVKYQWKNDFQHVYSPQEEQRKQSI